LNDPYFLKIKFISRLKDKMMKGLGDLETRRLVDAEKQGLNPFRPPGWQMV